MIKKIAILLAIACSLTVFCGCGSKETSSLDSASSLPPISVPSSISVTKVDSDEEWAYDVKGFEDTPHRIPHINVDSPEVEKLNGEIEEYFREVTKDSNTQNISYTVMVKGCLLSVFVEVVDRGWFSKGYAYNISLGNGSIIEDARTMAAYCGLTDEEYRIAAATAVTNEYGSLFGSFSDSNTGAYNQYLKKNQSKEVTDTFVGYINNRGELSFCGEMYSMDGNMRSFASTSVTGTGMGF